MMTYLNTFCNVRTKVLTYSQLHSLTHGFGLGPEEVTVDGPNLIEGDVTFRRMGLWTK